MNVPNVLTLSRFLLSVVLVFLLEQQSWMADVWAVVVFIAASLTDFYDGHLARTRGLISDFGKMMDPIADKVFLLSAFAVLAHLGLVEWWMFIVIALREILVTVSRIKAMYKGRVLAAEQSGKAKTVVQIAAVAVILFYLVAQPSSWFPAIQLKWLRINYCLMLTAVVLTIYSGFDYFRSKPQPGDRT